VATATLQAPSMRPAQAWVAALRVRTLGASVAPVLVGTAVAARHGALDFAVAGGTLAAALLIQLAVNLANDYYDHLKGVDRADRMGPPRVTGNVIPAARVKAAMVLALTAAALLGVWLASVGGLPVLLVGAASLVCAVAYAGGPRPLGHLGLGEIFVFTFFGPVAVAGTAFLQLHAWPADALLAGVPLGALSAAILVVNNVRDIPTDARAGKRTVAVRIGVRGSWMEYALLLALAYAMPLLVWVRFGLGAPVLLPLLTLPVGVLVLRRGTRATGPDLNPVLVQTAGLHALFGLLLALGVAL
jgi:1,4-dihydroxy-2-naphthoate polyprenyltransferase